jgi:hypothetical protein
MPNDHIPKEKSDLVHNLAMAPEQSEEPLKLRVGVSVACFDPPRDFEWRG